MLKVNLKKIVKIAICIEALLYYYVAVISFIYFQAGRAFVVFILDFSFPKFSSLHHICICKRKHFDKELESV